MNPLRLTASNYRTFGDLDLEIPSGATVICGPNGAGKSSIVNLIDVCLFAERGELAPLLQQGADTMELCLVFAHADRVYRARRGYSARSGGKTTFDLEYAVYEPNAVEDTLYAWEPLTLESTKASGDLIAEILGLSRTTFRASAFLRQGDGAAFTEAQPRDRKAILAEILALAVWDTLSDRARTDIRIVENELTTIASKIDEREPLVALLPDLKGKVAVQETIQAEGAKELAAAEAELERAQSAAAGQAAAAERVRACELERAAAEKTVDETAAALARARAAVTQLDQSRRELAELEQQAAAIPDLERRLQAQQARVLEERSARDRRAQSEALVAELDRASGKAHADILAAAARSADVGAHLDRLRAASDGEETCDRCHQQLGAQARAAAIASLQAEYEQIHAENTARLEAIVDTDQALADARAAAEAIEIPNVAEIDPHLESRLALARSNAERRSGVAVLIQGYEDLARQIPDLEISLQEAASDLTAKEQTLAAAAAELGDQAKLAHDVDSARRWVAQQRDILDRSRDELARLRANLEQAEASVADLDQLRADLARLHVRLDLLKLAELAFGRDGIPALIVENSAIPAIEAEANRILDELDTPYRVELRTQRALKRTDSLKETLDIVIHADGGERPYETFSGGERTRLNLALRIALARLLAHRRGAESRVLVIDEPEYLDEAGVARLADVLRGLQADFDKVILISHVPALAASFDQALTVVKDGDRSRIAGVAEAEAVAA